MANANQPACRNCAYKSEGETSIIICQNPMHFGLAMREESVCDSYYPEKPEGEAVELPGGKIITVSVGDVVGTEEGF